MNSLAGHFCFGNGLVSPMQPHGPDSPLVEMAPQIGYTSERFSLKCDLTTASATLYRQSGKVLFVLESSPGVREQLGGDKLPVLMAHLASDPAQALRRLNGSWILFFADEAREHCIFATDRAARRSPCFAVLPDRFVFGLTALDVAGQEERLRTIRLQAIFGYLYAHVIPAPGTIYEQVYRLCPGEYLDVTSTSVTRQLYWQPTYGEGPPKPRFAEAKAELLQRLEASVAGELDAGTAGAFLSGGTDSSTIAGMLTKVTGKAANTYSIGFDAPGFDEMDYARIAARHFGTSHREYYITPDDVTAGIPAVARAYDQPFGNSSALPAYYCAQLAKSDGIGRLLGGDGGDELFGGNTRYALQKIFDAYGRFAHPLADELVRMVLLRPDITRRLPGVRKARSYVEKAKVAMPARLQAYNLLIRIGVERILTPGFLAAIDDAAPAREEAAHYARCGAASLVNRMLHFDWKYTLADNDLPKVVGSCDLAGIPVGFPFLNEGLVEFANRLPPEWKVKGLRLRHFFKEALRDFLPAEIIAKKKHGFGLPFGLWLVKHPGLQRLAFGSLESLGTRGIIRRDFLEGILQSRLQQHASYYGELVWIMMMLEQWLQAHHPDFAVP